MSRLTKRKSDGDIVVDETLIFHPHTIGFNVVEKLAHYEDLEEQGRLIVVQEDVLVEIYNLVHDVGPAEIAEQIRADNLRLWTNRWRDSIKSKLAELKGTEE